MKQFSKQVYEVLKKIPAGRVTTYAAVARAAGRPRAYRAVGNILNKNPQPSTIPCHRVVRSDGSLGGYAGGVKKKITLLEKEGVVIKNGKIKRNSSYYLFR